MPTGLEKKKQRLDAVLVTRGLAQREGSALETASGSCMRSGRVSQPVAAEVEGEDDEDYRNPRQGGGRWTLTLNGRLP